MKSIICHFWRVSGAISDTVEAVDEQIEKLERIKEIEKMQEAKVRDLEEKLEEAQKDNRQLTGNINKQKHRSNMTVDSACIFGVLLR